MTDLLQKVLGKLDALPAEEQDAIALRWLEELEDDRRWEASFQKTTREQWARMAGKARSEHQAGRTIPLDDVVPKATPDR